MARSASPPALADLRHPGSTASQQVAALKQLKNELVGHEQRKEHAVRHGIVPDLWRILAASAKASGKRRSSREVNGAGGGANARGRVWSDEDEARLQATLIVGSLAYGGRALVTPLLAGSIHLPLLAALKPAELPPRLVLATLRTLLVIADAVGQKRFSSIDAPDSPAAHELADLIFSKPVVDSLAEILAQRTHNAIVAEQVVLTAQLVSSKCAEEQHQAALVRAGVLDLLVSRLVAVLCSVGYGVPTSDPAVIAALPPPVPREHLSHLLEAIGVIIQNSNYRTARFLCSPAIVGLFPFGGAHVSDAYMHYVTGNATNLPRQPTGMDWLLPHIQTVHARGEHGQSKSFPALGSFSSSSNLTRLHNFPEAHPPSLSRSVASDDFESPLLTVLLHLARTEQGVDRLTATWLLTLVTQVADRKQVTPWSDFSNKNRDRTLALLLVPLIVAMIGEDGSSDQKQTTTTPKTPLSEEARLVKERAPAVLASLISDSAALQKAAVDAGAIKKLCQLLKKSFDPPPPSTKPLWCPEPPNGTLSAAAADASSTPGTPGLPPEVLHAMRCREGALRALAAIAHSEDAYRKAIIENGIVSCIIDSLAPYPDQGFGVGSGAVYTGSVDAKAGNPTPVLIAACKAARAMSRSVSILRTSLIDAGVARPIFQLLKQPDVEVQIAATDVICNLLLEFSPMREDLIGAGAVKTLCEHAHSSNLRIRFISLWALKHLVLSASNDVKVSCLDELGANWLIQTINGESRGALSPHRAHSQSSTPLGMGTPNAAGEQVDLLNAIDEPSMDIDDELDDESEDDDDIMTDSIGALRGSRNGRHAARSHRARLRAIKEAEQNPALRAHRDDLQIQEQALDYIRNLITGIGAFEMIDHLLSTLGTARFFDLLGAKLVVARPLPPAHLHPRSRPVSTTDTLLHNNNTNKPCPPPSTLPRTTSPTPTPAPPPTEILLATLFILVHIAAGTPRHRTLLINQTPLLKSLIPLFAHHDRRVRVACVWLVNNLTWVDDTADTSPARARARELRYLGFDERLRDALLDPDLDVRERAKTALEQTGRLLDGGVGGGGAVGGGASGTGGAAGLPGSPSLLGGHAHGLGHAHGHAHSHVHASRGSGGGSSGGGGTSIGGNITAGSGAGAGSRFATG